MTLRSALLLALLALAACRGGDPRDGRRHLESLCDQERMREEYLDFYWDDLRSHAPELWAEALATCTETCPDAVNCGPVLSVAAWYAPVPATIDASTERSP